jgi:hypothetical protein
LPHIKLIFKHLLLLLVLLFPLSKKQSACYAQDTTQIATYDTAQFVKHSPRKASFYSAILPGMGQIYNKKYWKAPIIYAGVGALIYSIRFNQKYYMMYKTAYIQRMSGDPNNQDQFVKMYTDRTLLYAMNYYRRYRDMSVLGLAGVYIANIIDATVDAYLFDYSVNQDLSMRIKPTIISSPYSFDYGISCIFRF